jgi:hypothetical protein
MCAPAKRRQTFKSLTETDRTKRVKDARSEAQKEIEEYRGQKEDEFKQFEQEVANRPPDGSATGG